FSRVAALTVIEAVSSARIERNAIRGVEQVMSISYRLVYFVGKNTGLDCFGASLMVQIVSVW
ncbi:MAG: hypothetical protein PHV87_00080, partial [Bacilli bacterium]|nr:hypothetical protein [Bacilli bacterium]